MKRKPTSPPYAPGEVVNITAKVEGEVRSYKIINPGAGRIGSKLSIGTPYEKDLLVDILRDNHQGTAFDVGAHLGNHSLWLAGICGLRVYAWEPYPKSREQLEANLRINPALDITVLDWAAGAEEGRGRFTPGMWIEFDPTRNGDKIKVDRGTVQIYPIDHMLDIPTVSVVKVDVEGMEAMVLAGMKNHLRRYRPVVYAETHTEEMRRDIKQVLGPIGYQNTKDIQMGSLMTKWVKRR